MMSSTIVKRANIAFRQEEYQEAKALYQKAADAYGSAIFDVNILLCARRLSSNNKKEPVVPGLRAELGQLKETQRLLEHYYHRCQELEYKLLDNAANSLGKEQL